MSDTPKVYEAIASVMEEIGKDGIAKNQRNQQQGYSFRGIDSVYNALSPILAKHRLLMLPRILARECVERTTKSGSALFYVTVEAEFDLVSAEDGSRHIIRTFGEAMDSADKATNKAMSAAYKYAAMQAFAIPTEGDNDADFQTHEVAPSSAPATPAAKPASKMVSRPLDGEMRKEIDATTSAEALEVLWFSAEFQKALKSLPADWQAAMREHANDHRDYIAKNPPRNIDPNAPIDPNSQFDKMERDGE